MRRILGLLVLVLALVGSAHATTTTVVTTTTTTTTQFQFHFAEIDTVQSCTATCSTGTAPSGQAGDGMIGVFDVTGSASVVAQFGFTGTVAGEIDNSIDSGANWTPLTSGTFSSTTASPQKFVISEPVGWYRFNVTTCTSCTYKNRYFASPRGLH